MKAERTRALVARRTSKMHISVLCSKRLTMSSQRLLQKELLSKSIHRDKSLASIILETCASYLKIMKHQEGKPHLSGRKMYNHPPSQVLAYTTKAPIITK